MIGLSLTCNQYTAYWDGKDAKTQQEVASGVYLYRLEVDGKGRALAREIGLVTDLYDRTDKSEAALAGIEEDLARERVQRPDLDRCGAGCQGRQPRRDPCAQFTGRLTVEGHNGDPIRRHAAGQQHPKPGDERRRHRPLAQIGVLTELELEVAEARWLPLDDAPRLLAYGGEREMAEKARSALVL